MPRVLIGQLLLIICCFFYLIWWYRGYRPGVVTQRVAGINGFLFLATAFFGVAGLVFSLMDLPVVKEARLSPAGIVLGGIITYFILFLVTRSIFHRIVTTELFLILGWTVLELTVINRLNATGILSGRGFTAMCIVVAMAFVVSMVLYVAYYRMDELKAFYAAMVPLVIEAASMAVLICIVLREGGKK